MRRLVCVAVLGAVTLLAASPGLAAKPKIKQSPKLTGTVGDNGQLTLMSGAGKAVGTLKPGWYTLLARDLGTDRNFRTKGPGVNTYTTVKFRGAALWGVRLRKGTYVFQSDPQKTTMRRSFTVS